MSGIILQILIFAFYIVGGNSAVYLFFREKPRRVTEKIYLPAVLLLLFAGFAGCVIYSHGNPSWDFDYLILEDLAVAGSPLLIYPVSKKRSYKYCLIAIAFNLIAGIAVNLLFLALGTDMNDAVRFYGYLAECIVSGLLSGTIFAVSLFFAKTKRKNTALTKINAPLYLMIIMTITLFVLTMLYFGFTSKDNLKGFILSLINISLVSFTVFYALRKYLRSKYSEEVYKQQLDSQIKYYELMDRKNEELRVFRHDMPKKLRPLAMYLESGNIEDAKQIVKEFNVSVDSSRPRFSTGNYRLDTVLESQQQIAEKDGIVIELVRGSCFPAEGIESGDIYTIFPNALDNAIEACRKNGGKTITFESNFFNGIIYVKISNPADEKINITESGISTTKKDKANHGFGTKSIKKAAANYGSDNVKYESKDGRFSLMLSLKVNETT